MNAAKHGSGVRNQPRWTQRAPTHEGHLIGRSTAITMVMLGEAVLQISTGYTNLKTHEAGAYRFAIAGWLLVVALAIQTFSTIPQGDHHALGRSLKRGFIWRLLTAAACYAILFVGCAIKVLEYDLIDEFECYDDDDDYARRLGAAASASKCHSYKVKKNNAEFLAISISVTLLCYCAIRFNHKGLQLHNWRRLVAYGARVLTALSHMWVYGAWTKDMGADGLVVRHAVAAIAAVVVDHVIHIVDLATAGKDRPKDAEEFSSYGDPDTHEDPSSMSIRGRMQKAMKPRAVVARAYVRRADLPLTNRGGAAAATWIFLW